MNTRRIQCLAIVWMLFTLTLLGVARHASVTHAADNQGAPAAEGAFSGNDPVHPTTDITVLTVNISNEPPGYLIDYLYDTLGNVGFFEALGYLKDHSNGVISEEFYHNVDTVPGGEEVKLTLLRDYRRPFTDSVEIAENGTVHVRKLRGNAAHPGFTTMISPDGHFNLTYTLDPAYYIHTGTISYADFICHYKSFAIAWRGYYLLLPLIIR